MSRELDGNSRDRSARDDVRREAERITAAIAGRDAGTDPFTATVRATRMPMIITDPRQADNPVVFANDAFCRLTGYEREEILGRNCRFLQGPETDRATIGRIREAVRAVESLEIDIRNHRKTGEPFWNRLLMSPVHDAAGDLAYFFASQVDVTLERERLSGLESHNAALMAEVAGRLHAQRESETRLRFATEAGRFGVWELDLRTRELTTSAVCRENYGHSGTAPFTYDDLRTTFHPRDRDRILAAIDDAVTTGADYNEDYRILRPDGSTGWVHVRGQAVRAADGSALRMAGISVDITARKAAETHRLALVDLGDRIRDLNNPADLGFAAAEILGRALDISRAGYGTIDLAAETVTIERDWNAPGIESLAGVLRFRDYGSYIDDLRRGETVVFADAEQDPRTVANAEALKAISAQSAVNMPVTEQGGLVALLYLNHAVARAWSAEELTLIREMAERTRVAVARVRAEAALQDMNVTLEARVAERTRERDRAWRMSQDLLAVLEVDTRLAAVNAAWTALLGWDERELVGLQLSSLTHPDDLKATMASLMGIVEAPLSRPYENRLRHKDGTYRWFSWTGAFDAGSIFASGRNTTSEHEQAAALAATQEALRQSQKLEAVGQLTGGVAHDFNNLLTIIKSSTDLLRRPDLAEQRRRRYVDAISDTVDRAAKLTGQLLAFARRQALKPEVFDVGQRVQAVTDMLSSIVGSRIRVDTRIACESCYAEADLSQFETAVVNMAVNARDAMDGEGTLTVGVREMAEIPAIRGHGGGHGQFVAVLIEDTGCGIPAEKLGQIFEPFFTTKEVGRGTGLGLSQVYGFAKQSGGDVGVESSLGRGTVFTLYLPRVQPEAAIEDAPARDTVPVENGRGRRVLVVEDNVEVGRFSTQLLQDIGYETTWAANGEEALRLLETGERFDVVFSDVVMPGMSGVELGRTLRRSHPSLPVVLTSGYSHVLAEEGRHGFDLLQKPYAVEELSRLLRRVTSRSARSRSGQD